MIEHPERVIVLAVVLMVVGCVLPFLMVLQIIPSTLFLNLLSYTLSTLGFLLGMAAVAILRAKWRNEDRDR